MEQQYAFFDVFQDLQVKDTLRQQFADVKITRAVMSQKQRHLTVYMVSTHLIEHHSVKEMEQSIASASFSNMPFSVTLYLEYKLSEQYTAEAVMQMHYDSIMEAIREQSKVAYNLLRKAEWSMEENILTFLLEDSFLARSHSEDIKSFIEERFDAMYHLPVTVGFDYTEEQKQALREAKKHKLKMEVANAIGKNEQMPQEAVTETMDSQQPAQKKESRKSEKKEAVSKNDYQPSKNTRKNTIDRELVYGRNVDGDIVPISSLESEHGEVVIHGQIISMDFREIRNEKTIVSFVITDFTDSIKGKLFVKNEMLDEIKEAITVDGFYRIKAIAAYDSYDREVSLTSVIGIKAIPSFVTKRMDISLEKRVELHMHTVMSEMDSVVDIEKMIKRAKEWGHPAVAITDHGCLQAFPIANHCIEKDDPFKIIYGVEGYFIDDELNIVTNSKGQSFMDTFVVFDIETTGFRADRNKIIEIGAVKIQNGVISDSFSEFVNPKEPIPFQIEELTGISDAMVMDAPEITEILPKFFAFCADAVLVAHNAEFDIGFIAHNAKVQGLPFEPTYIDTVSLSRMLLPQLSRYKLNTIAKHLNISLENHHRAIDDAMATGEIFIKLLGMLEKKGITNLDECNEQSNMTPEMIKKLPYYHGIILVRNDVGRVNLNRLVSASHIDYFNRRPRMPKSLINQYRDGLILGSACEAGELYQALLREKSKEEIVKIINFYDYLEIQPLGNNRFMFRDEKSWVNSDEDLIQLNKQIIELGEEFHKPVVATCDVHFLDPEDEQYRRFMMAGKGFKDADEQAPLYYRTTEEMLEEFSYLSPEKAREIVIENTNKIADMIEKISPVHPDKCPPVIENSDETLREICYNRAHEIYGPELPPVVEERLSRELHSIISNGFAVMYIIAQKLVWDSNDHGYLVGSRGSVGSSFAATMAGITEVNPLSPHYICPNCHFTDFDSEEVLKYSGCSGCDMPDRNCPHCGTPLLKEGHDIPFETFLGFKGDKEPDIDLNFSGDYQACAHAYTEELFGKGHAFRAGTITTLAEKTARGYVYKYFEERGIHKRQCELDRLAVGLTGPKRSTGQHPGGIIVVPADKEIYDFTAVQRPANDVDSTTTTTHFEYHSIDHNLLKLDILGHDDPTMIRALEDFTGLDSKTIPFDNKEVMSLFHSTEALGITPEDIGGTPLGSLGIPEFGTDFVIGMLLDTHPQSFSDLLRISGLSHGTDVWLGNAQKFIEEGKATISTAICTRDDIMTYLIHMGMDKGLSFTIMESVRKGKGLKPEWEEEMRNHNIEEWYIESCKLIKYMFPKAHAAAYVMMAWRIAYYKVFYPHAYYAAYFSIRAKSFNYETMCQGKERLEYHLAELQKMDKNQQTAKELDTIKDMKIVQEMYARGIEFMPIELYTAKDKYFQIIDNKIMPSFAAIDGMGERAATAVMEQAAKGPFLSKEDFRIRTKVTKTVTDKMAELGLLGDLPETNQLSFSFFE
ncbi:MAG: PolC-type DNA polymerase III [Lachnospiraceae bacterium]